MHIKDSSRYYYVYIQLKIDVIFNLVLYYYTWTIFTNYNVPLNLYEYT